MNRNNGSMEAMVIPNTQAVLDALRERHEAIQRARAEQRLLLRQLRVSEAAAEELEKSER